MKLEFSQQIFEKHSTTRFNENPSICSMRTDGQTDMTKLIFTFRNFTNAPKHASGEASEHKVGLRNFTQITTVTQLYSQWLKEGRRRRHDRSLGSFLSSVNVMESTQETYSNLGLTNVQLEHQKAVQQKQETVAARLNPNNLTVWENTWTKWW